MEGGKAKAGGQNERMELIGKGRERTDRKKEKRVGRERAKGGQVVWCERRGRTCGTHGGKGMGIREQTERNKREKRGAKRDWDISNV